MAIATIGKFQKPAQCHQCPAAVKHIGFCPDKIVSGARFAVWAQSPGQSEIMRVPPEPLVGQAGFVLENWIIPRAGLQGYPMSKCNTIRCHPPGDKYPTGKVRRAAEAQCRQYDQVTPADFDVTLVTLHPAGVMRTKFDPLPLIIRDFQRAKMLLDQGKSVLVLMGTEAMDLWAPDLRHPQKGSNYGVTDWRGHYWAKDGSIVPGVPQTGTRISEMLFSSTLSVDLEWSRDTHLLSQVGLWNNKGGINFAWSPNNKGALQQILDTAGEIVMHNGLGAMSDVEVLEHNGLGLRSPLRDTMLAMHLLWPQLAGLGFLDLWTCASLCTDAPNWKICRGSHCVGACPVHEPEWYNLTDAWAAS